MSPSYARSNAFATGDTKLTSPPAASDSSTPTIDTVRWFSDASALTRYGIETVNYGTSSGLPGPDGENLDIEGLVKIATVYALAITRICEPMP